MVIVELDVNELEISILAHKLIVVMTYVFTVVPAILCVTSCVMFDFDIFVITKIHLCAIFRCLNRANDCKLENHMPNIYGV